MKEQAITTNDLELLNRFTLKEMTTDNVAVFSMLIIDESETSNGRIWTREWMKEAVKRNLFDGVPFLTNHENDQATKIGTIFSANLRNEGIFGKVFIPLDEQGLSSKEAIENGRIRNVSINASGEAKEIDGKTHILPSDDMRVFEVSAVAVGGCKTCTIKEKANTEPCESESGDPASPLLEFATLQLSELRASFIRLAGFTLGTSNRETYAKVADALDPITLKAFAEDFRKAYESRAIEQNESQESESTDAATDVLAALKEIQKIKGV
jgi:hypothetical protein